RRLAEIAEGRRVDAVGAGAEIDAVEIELEDAALGEPGLKPQRQHDLLDLSLEGPLRFQEQVLRQLLGEGRTALDDAARLIVGEEGPDEADRIDTEMMIEAPVLDGDDRLRQIGRHLLE